jgi:23S rRNA U2552 (ribose-2'-O)-methylase RlmE/FtsJ
MTYKLVWLSHYSMVEKYILKLDRLESSSISNDVFFNDTNRLLHEILIKYKNKITPYYGNKKWDRYKKLSNEYECVFMTPQARNNVSNFTPISRSYFKMWEMLIDFRREILFMEDNSTPIQCLFLAEGPGGFLEATMRKRCNKSDMYFGFTLRPEHKSIPDWKLNSFTKKQLKQINLLYGKDGTGNLYNLENIDYVANQLGGNSMHLITADGGFDFSANFNNQEQQSFKLICCEIYCALNLLTQDGSFIIKVYDMFNMYTLHIISILRKAFKSVFITKPLTSRPANSEKYIVCCGFDVDIGKAYIDELRNICNNTYNAFTTDDKTLNDVVMYNTYATSRQVVYIQKTIDTIEYLDSATPQERNIHINETIECNKHICLEWCKKYDVPFTLSEASP